MTIWKRAGLFVRRKKTKSLLMGGILTALSTFVLISMSLQQSIQRYVTEIRESVGSSFSVSNNNGTISRDLVAAIESLEGIKQLNPTVLLYGLPVDFSNIETELKQGIDSVDKGVALVGTADIFLQKKFVKQIYQLTSFEKGNLLQQQNTVILNEQLAKNNQLQIGDMIELESNQLQGKGAPKVKQKLRIVGLFKNSEEEQNNYVVGVDKIENTMYVDLATSQHFQENKSGDYFQVDVFCKEPDQLEEMMKKVKTMATTKSLSLRVLANSSDYEQMAQPLIRLETFIVKLLRVIFVASVILFTLILNLWIKERQKEAGILLSIGKTKINIVLQFIIEMLMIHVVSFVGAILLCLLFSRRVVGNYMTSVYSPLLQMYIITFSGVGLTVIIAVILASSSLLKYKPKEILSRLS